MTNCFAPEQRLGVLYRYSTVAAWLRHWFVRTIGGIADIVYIKKKYKRETRECRKGTQTHKTVKVRKAQMKTDNLKLH